MEKETLMGDIFDAPEIGSLFEPIKEEQIQKVDEVIQPSLFEKEEEKPSPDILETSSLFNTEDVNSDDNQEDEGDEQISYGKIVQSLLKDDETFQIYEGDDPEKLEYSKDQFLDLFKQNIQIKGEQIAEAVLEQAISQLSPTVQKLVTGELNGIKISDIVKDLEDYQELDSLPEDPTQEQKEKIVRKYYSRIAKEKNKDAEWLNNKIEKIIDNDDLDSEFEDAKDEIQKDLDKKQQEKAQELNKQKEEKELFKKYHTHYVNEALKEENIFNIKLTKEQKNKVATVLSSFLVRPTDNKEKLGLTAMIDNFIHNENPKESYKRLVLMTLAGIAPDEFVKNLTNQTEKKVTNDTVKKLKTIQNSITSLEPERKQTIKKIGNIF